MISEIKRYSLSCDKCGKYYGECDYVIPLSDRAIKDGWVFNENTYEWLCPDCAGKEVSNE